MLSSVALYGNSSAATIPLTLSLAAESKAICNRPTAVAIRRWRRPYGRCSRFRDLAFSFFFPLPPPLFFLSFPLPLFFPSSSLFLLPSLSLLSPLLFLPPRAPPPPPPSSRVFLLPLSPIPPPHFCPLPFSLSAPDFILLPLSPTPVPSLPFSHPPPAAVIHRASTASSPPPTLLILYSFSRFPLSFPFPLSRPRPLPLLPLPFLVLKKAPLPPPLLPFLP